MWELSRDNLRGVRVKDGFGFYLWHFSKNRDPHLVVGWVETETEKKEYLDKGVLPDTAINVTFTYSVSTEWQLPNGKGSAQPLHQVKWGPFHVRVTDMVKEKYLKDKGFKNQLEDLAW
jgi:hypothetical protein